MRLIDKKRDQLKAQIEAIEVDIDELTEDLDVTDLPPEEVAMINFRIHNKKNDVHAIEQRLEALDIIELTAELYL